MMQKHHNGSVEKPLDFGKIYAIVIKNWMILKRDKIRVFAMTLFPIVMIVLYGFTAGALPKHIYGAIVDYDNSNYSHLVESQLYANQQYSIKHLLGSQDEGKKLIESGEIKILFIIPRGFQDDIEQGRTAQLIIMVDEADPTVAQITRGATISFIQSISDQITASKISAIGAKAQVAQGYLASASSSISSVIKQTDTPQVTATDKAYSEASNYYRSENGVIVATIQGMKNSLGGELVDQNQIADSFSSSTDPNAALALLAVGDQQEAVLQQIAGYQGIQDTNNRLFKSVSTIYSNAKGAYANALYARLSLGQASKSVSAASQLTAQIASDAGKAATGSVRVSEVEPYGSGRAGLDFLIPNILALIIFQGAVFGLGRAIAGERKDGSLTRVFMTPTSNLTIIIGTLLFYVIFETIRSSAIVFLAMILFGVTIKGSIFAIIGIIAVYSVGCTGVGMVLSVVAKSQEQYLSIAQLFTLPTLFLSGVFIPIETMPPILQSVARALPITYASDALRAIMIKGLSLQFIATDIFLLFGFAMCMIVLSVLLFKRELL